MDDDSPIQPWTPKVQVTSTVAHVVGILATIFRLQYRWQSSKFWWEDTWAALALICDIACLISVWMQTAPHKPSFRMPRINFEAAWLLSLTLTSVLWFARMSIWCSIVRIANPTPRRRLITYCVGGMFLAMEAGLLAQRIFVCVEYSCWVTTSVTIMQLVTDVISDIILVATPIWFLRDVKLSRDRRILIISVFSASLLITGVTIFHSILLFDSVTNVTIIIGHMKAALALFLCNALVLVMFAYRLFRKPALDVERFMAEGHDDAVEFTSIIDLPSKFSSHGHIATTGIQGSEDLNTKAPASGTSVGQE